MEQAPAATRPGWRHRWPGRLLAAGGWLVVGGLAVAVALRQAPLVLDVPLSWVPTFLPVLSLLVVPALALGLVLRRKALVSVAAVLVLVGGLLYVPEWGTGARAAPADGVPIRVVSANLLFLTGDVDGLVARIEAERPDVVMTQETTEVHRRRLDEAGMSARYPHQVAERPDFGTVLWSRWPLTGTRLLDAAGRPLPAAEVATPAGTVQLVAVHLSPPTFGVAAWARQLDGLAEAVPHLRCPLLAGDFNATTDHWPFRRLLDAGLVDGHLTGGSGFGTTWPEGHRLVPVPVLRIDHVLTGAGLEVVRLDAERNGGSDHRLLVADVVVRGPCPAPGSR